MLKNYFTIFLFFITTAIFAQVNENEIILKDKQGKASIIKFKKTKISSDSTSIKKFLKKQYQLDDDINFKVKVNSHVKAKLFTSQKMEQYYKGVKVEFGEIAMVFKNGKLSSLNGKILTIHDLNLIPKLSEKTALSDLLKKINATKYAWQDASYENFLKKEKKDSKTTYYPSGKLVIIDKNIGNDHPPTPVLAYKFDVYAIKPLSKAFYYVDASTGKLILKDAIIKQVLGNADTRYSGQRNIETQENGSSYRLRDYTRGNGIETYDMNNGTDYGSATDFTDNDNNWTALEYHNSDKDDAALDAHWGAEKTYDYFLQEHNRHSYNNNNSKLKNCFRHLNNTRFIRLWRMLYHSSH